MLWTAFTVSERSFCNSEVTGSIPAAGRVSEQLLSLSNTLDTLSHHSLICQNIKLMPRDNWECWHTRTHTRTHTHTATTLHHNLKQSYYLYKVRIIWLLGFKHDVSYFLKINTEFGLNGFIWMLLWHLLCPEGQRSERKVWSGICQICGLTEFRISKSSFSYGF